MTSLKGGVIPSEVSVICNPVVQIAALKQPVYCAQFPAVFQG